MRHSCPKWLPSRGMLTCDSCHDPSVPSNYLPVGNLRVEGGAAIQFAHARLALPRVWGLCPFGGSGVSGLLRAIFPGAQEGILPHPPSSGAAFNIPFPALLRPQGAQTAERLFPWDLRFRSELAEGNAYPEGMNWELWDFSNSRKAEGVGRGFGEHWSPGAD